MSMKKLWKNYCDGDIRSATEDDWNNFVAKVYAGWRGKKMKEDANKPSGHASEILKYAEENYGYKAFIETAEEYQQLSELESSRSDS
jgi:hypothetical protein